MAKDNSVELIKAAILKYNSYSNEWRKAYFDVNSGGFNVYHERHKFSEVGGGGEAEEVVGKILAKQGKQVEFLPEEWQKQPDIKFDNQTWDIKFIDKANEETIKGAIRDARKADNAIFYFTQENQYQLLKNATEREVGRFIKGQVKTLPDIHYLDKNGCLKLLWEKQKGAK